MVAARPVKAPLSWDAPARRAALDVRVCALKIVLSSS